MLALANVNLLWGLCLDLLVFYAGLCIPEPNHNPSKDTKPSFRGVCRWSAT